MAPDAASFAKSEADDDVVAGEVIVKLRDDADVDAVAKRMASAGDAGLRPCLRRPQTSNGNERAMAARLAADPRVEYAEPNYIRHVDAIDSRLWAF